tara:strand:+ start:806 stop:1030 length:225 start_codon:yes stop_codon:yes gene_type:complete
MAKYECSCGVIELSKTTLKVVGDKVIVPEAYCDNCKDYRVFIKEHKGFANIVKKPNGTVSNSSFNSLLTDYKDN